MLVLHDRHYWYIQATGTEAPTSDFEKLILCKKSNKATFETENVNALEVKEDDSDSASDKYSVGNYREKTLKKKNRKFGAEEEQKVESELKNLSDKKGTSEEGSNSALDEKVSKVELREKIDMMKND